LSQRDCKPNSTHEFALLAKPYTQSWSTDMPPASRLISRLDRRSALALFGGFVADAAFAPTMLRAQLNPDWTTPLPPFRIAGNLHYVGSRDLASYLITTPRGHILLNSNLSTSPAQIRTSVEKLGFHFHDVKILLISHGHYDHCAGSAEIKKLTGAKYMVMDADVSVVESGGRTDFHYANDPAMRFPATKVDRVLHDAETVQFGGVELTAHKTPGHTKGCTTWTMDISNDLRVQKTSESRQPGGDINRAFRVVIVGSPNVNPGYRLVDNSQYPQIASDYAQCFHVLRSLPCDIFLGAHGGYFNMLEKINRLKAGDKNTFIDPTGYKAYIAERQQAFEVELARQQKARRS
jgi:metallo-beta-lactamase class B